VESLFKKLSFSSATVVFVILIAIFATLLIKAKPAIEAYGLSFFTHTGWGIEVPIDKDGHKINRTVVKEEAKKAGESVSAYIDEHYDKTITMYGGLAPIIGTVFSTIIAMVFSIPIAMGIAIYLAEIAPSFLKAPVGIAIELLAAIPSIIYGMWGLFYFAPMVQGVFGGFTVSLLTAGLVLGIMVLPFMASITRDAMNTTPDVLKESAYAMGATKFEVIKDIIFPYAKKGIFGSIILSLGRALGETMAVAFLIGSVFKIPQTITFPTISIPVAMANNFGEANGLGENSLFYLALILFVMSFAVIGFAKFYLFRTKA
jgi:phosphate transport system permease protein